MRSISALYSWMERHLGRLKGNIPWETSHACSDCYRAQQALRARPIAMKSANAIFKSAQATTRVQCARCDAVWGTKEWSSSFQSTSNTSAVSLIEMKPKYVELHQNILLDSSSCVTSRRASHLKNCTVRCLSQASKQEESIKDI